METGRAAKLENPVAQKPETKNDEQLVRATNDQDTQPKAKRTHNADVENLSNNEKEKTNDARDRTLSQYSILVADRTRSRSNSRHGNRESSLSRRRIRYNIKLLTISLLLHCVYICVYVVCM